MTSASTEHRDHLPETFVWRFTILGAAALGFLVTFILLDHQIHAFKDVILPLLVILPAYLCLTSLNMWWAAKTTARLGQMASPVTAQSARRLRAGRAVTACCGLAFGVLVALWYVHSVSR